MNLSHSASNFLLCRKYCSTHFLVFCTWEYTRQREVDLTVIKKWFSECLSSRLPPLLFSTPPYLFLPKDFYLILLCEFLSHSNNNASHYHVLGHSLWATQHIKSLHTFFQLLFATVRYQVLCLLHWHAGPSPLTPPGKASLVYTYLQTNNIVHNMYIISMLIILQ